MPCGCKKKGSGSTFLSGVTWKGYGPYKQGKGMSFRGGGLKKKQKRKKKKGGLVITGSGVGFTGSGYIFDGSGFKRRVGYRKK